MSTKSYLPVLAGVFTATLAITNILNNKLFTVFGFALPAGILTFPLTFLVADALTEVWGYAATRKVIWTGLAVQLFMAALILAAIELPPAGFWPLQKEFAAVLNQVPRLVVASVLAYFSGEFCNSYVLAKSKVRAGGERMWVRFVTSTMAGEAVDTLVFMSVAFLGVFPAEDMAKLFVASWLFKVLWEVMALPVSIPLVRWLKKAEQEDHFDRSTNFNPFRA